jgi:hypothetical protein
VSGDFSFEPFLYTLPELDIVCIALERSGISVYYIGSASQDKL